MNIQQKLQNKRLPIILTLIVVAAMSVGGALWLRADSSAEATAKPKPAKPMFSFGGAPGWWQGATNETSMAVFDEDTVHACFVSAEYKTGTVDAAAEVKKIHDQLTEYGAGYISTELGSKTLDLQTDSGPLKYELRQSSVVTPAGGEKLKGGQEFGYIQLANGYVKIMGYCDSPDQLADTIPVLQAIKLDIPN